jgi:hypothetical protein
MAPSAIDSPPIAVRPQLKADVKVTYPDQLRRIKKGDQVYTVYTQALAMLVETVPKK